MQRIHLIVASLGLLLIVLLLFPPQKKEQPPQFQPDQITFVEPELPAPLPPATFETALQTIQESELKKNLEYLASDELEGRMSGKRGNVVAADFIKKKFEAAGLKTIYHKFDIQRMNPGPKKEQGDDFTQNIYAWIEGVEFPNEIVVVGAHMDHIGYGPQMSRAGGGKIHPGADDNASGTVALIEIAEAIAILKPKRTVVFMAFSAEEMGLIGSRYYCSNPLFPRNSPNIRSHVAMINMDMIGYLGKGRYFTGFYSGDSSSDISKFIRELNSKYTFAEKITSRGSGGSDHASFYNKKVPIAFLHTGLHPYYHTPQDTADKINFKGVEQIAQYAFELTWKIAEADTTPQFNYGAFKEMDYTHDHGHPEHPFPHHYHRH